MSRYNHSMKVDEAAILAKATEGKRDILRALADIDQAIAECQEAWQELIEAVRVVERVEHGDFLAMKEFVTLGGPPDTRESRNNGRFGTSAF